jgi:hypothetical protein
MIIEFLYKKAFRGAPAEKSITIIEPQLQEPHPSSFHWQMIVGAVVVVVTRNRTGNFLETGSTAEIRPPAIRPHRFLKDSKKMDYYYSRPKTNIG